MDIFASYKLTTRIDTDVVTKWIQDNDMFERVSYDWIKRIITFSDTEDAVAFSLTFGLVKHETKIDKMLENEKSNN